MKKPDHIPQPAWDKAVELLVTAPSMWLSGICAGGYIPADGDLLIKDRGETYVIDYYEDEDPEYVDYDDYEEEDEE